MSAIPLARLLVEFEPGPDLGHGPNSRSSSRAGESPARIAEDTASDSPVWRLRENAGMKLPQRTTRTRWPLAKRLPVRRFGRRIATISPGAMSFGAPPPSRSLTRRTSVPGLERFQAVPSGATSSSLTQRSASRMPPSRPR